MTTPNSVIRHRGICVRRRRNAGGSISFRVECPISWFDRTTFRQFKTKEEAKHFIDLQMDQRAMYGKMANLLTAEQRLDAHNAYERLNNANVSLVDCVDFYLKHAETAVGNISMAELIVSYLEDCKRGKGTRNGRPLRERSMQDIKNRLEKFAVTFGAMMPGEVASSEIENWLHRDEWSLQTRRNYYRALHTLFSYACRKGFCPQNPISAVSEPKPEEKAPAILTIAQCEKLLSSALLNENELGMLGYVALGLFCGIRTAELNRMEWSAVDLEAGLVTVNPEIAKARSIRNTTIPENAIEWLMHCGNRSGSIVPVGFRKRFDQVRAGAGITNWSTNAMRHSAGSYHYAMYEDAAKTAAFLGHAQDGVLFRHYRALTRKKDAEQFYSLLPASGCTGKSRRQTVVMI